MSSRQPLTTLQKLVLVLIYVSSMAFTFHHPAMGIILTGILMFPTLVLAVHWLWRNNQLQQPGIADDMGESPSWREYQSKAHLEYLHETQRHELEKLKPIARERLLSGLSDTPKEPAE